jgi:hypothetical protein
MKKAQRAALLLDHHKDTFQHILYHWQVRNRLFIYVLVLLAVTALDTYSPDSIARMVNGYIAKLLDTPENAAPLFDFKVIGCVIWFLLLSLVISYYQRSISVDRQYRYIDQLEQQLCAEMGGDFITRESKSYYSKTGAYRPNEPQQQPWFIRLVGPLYTYFFPAILVMFIGYKLYKQDLPPKDVTDVFNLVIGSVIILYNFLYVLWVVDRR